MSKSIFISCVHEDSHRIKSIENWAASGRLGNVVITHETEDKRHEGKEAIKHHIKSKIQEQGSSLFWLDKTHTTMTGYKQKLNWPTVFTKR